jgi:hypothetical protein
LDPVDGPRASPSETRVYNYMASQGSLELVKLEDHNKAGPDPTVYSPHRAP